MEIIIKTIIVNKDEHISGYDTVDVIKRLVENKYNSICYYYEDEVSKILKIPFLYTGVDTSFIDKKVERLLLEKTKLNELLKIDAGTTELDGDTSKFRILLKSKILDSWWGRGVFHQVSWETEPNIVRLIGLWGNSKLKENRINKNQNLVKYSRISTNNKAYLEDMLILIDYGIEVNLYADTHSLEVIIPYVEIDNDTIYGLSSKFTSYIAFKDDKEPRKIKSGFITLDSVDLNVMAGNLIRMDEAILEIFDGYFYDAYNRYIKEDIKGF